MTTTNSYFDPISGEYTAPLLITAPSNTSGQFVYTFHLGDATFISNYSTSAIVEIISNRDYQIEYSCMGSDYDLITKGYQFQSSLTNAYSGANTSISFSTNITNIPVENIAYITNNYLMSWGHQYATNGVNHDPNIVVLFGVQDYDGSEVRYGTTARDPDPANPKKSYSFVFTKRIDDNLASYSDQDKQVMKTRTAIHELGHARRKDLSYVDYSEEHIHEGRYKSICAMMQLNVYDPKKAFNFCERHKQVFLNISW